MFIYIILQYQVLPQYLHNSNCNTDFIKTAEISIPEEMGETFTGENELVCVLICVNSI